MAQVVKIESTIGIFVSSIAPIIRASKIVLDKVNQGYTFDIKRSPNENLDITVATITLSKNEIKELIKKLHKCIQE